MQQNEREEGRKGRGTERENVCCGGEKHEIRAKTKKNDGY
jgi:hypothetical protein